MQRVYSRSIGGAGQPKNLQSEDLIFKLQVFQNPCDAHLCTLPAGRCSSNQSARQSRP
ncbi:hypothetical protein MIZ03_0953 [Rhodoferax lithotrophicus]|uniref:Uncharacterized protein n=1 Tax=Rhodoferax lithotrophicus TaxID=2798804 RepID=A0ABN6D383_9BURK|nr:hypothetical protein MIZ03_0953 [Rhodoferax sp. MIZ03]